jgi:hypothetical protein
MITASFTIITQSSANSQLVAFVKAASITALEMQLDI